MSILGRGMQQMSWEKVIAFFFINFIYFVTEKKMVKLKRDFKDMEFDRIDFDIAINSSSYSLITFSYQIKSRHPPIHPRKKTVPFKTFGKTLSDTYFFLSPKQLPP